MRKEIWRGGRPLATAQSQQHCELAAPILVLGRNSRSRRVIVLTKTSRSSKHLVESLGEPRPLADHRLRPPPASKHRKRPDARSRPNAGASPWLLDLSTSSSARSPRSDCCAPA